MCGSATFAMELSSTSMNVASVTVMATIHGLIRGRHIGAGANSLGLSVAMRVLIQILRSHSRIQKSIPKFRHFASSRPCLFVVIPEGVLLLFVLAQISGAQFRGPHSGVPGLCSLTLGWIHGDGLIVDMGGVASLSSSERAKCMLSGCPHTDTHTGATLNPRLQLAFSITNH